MYRWANQIYKSNIGMNIQLHFCFYWIEALWAMGFRIGIYTTVVLGEMDVAGVKLSWP